MFVNTYYILDKIADSFIPTLLIVIIASFLTLYLKKKSEYANKRLISFVITIVFVYTIMLIDQKYSIFPALNLDYSTHAALSFTCVTFLILSYRKIVLIWVLLWCTYLILMIYQKYHSLTDIVVTTLLVAPFVVIPLLKIGGFQHIDR